MKKTLYLMRHGQTIFNQLHNIQGWCDSPLTPLGIAQAKHAAHYFADNQITFDHVYSVITVLGFNICFCMRYATCDQL